MRFALLEIKMLLASVLSKYKFVKCEQTQVGFLILKSISMIFNLHFLAMIRCH